MVVEVEVDSEVVDEGEGEEEVVGMTLVHLRELQVNQLTYTRVCCLILFSTIIELGVVLHPCENDLVCKGTNASIPYFNAPIYLENKSQIGKVDEIFGPMNEFVSYVWIVVNELLVIILLNDSLCVQLFSVKVGPDMQASSFNKGHKVDMYEILILVNKT